MHDWELGVYKTSRWCFAASMALHVAFHEICRTSRGSGIEGLWATTMHVPKH